MAGEGQILRGAREQKGWNIMQAEEITKIRVRYLEALEEENYGILPGSTYIKGFLRTYAKHLGLNSEEIVSLYKSSEVLQTPPKLEPVNQPPRKNPQWLKPVVLAATGLLALIIVIAIANLSSPKNKPNTAEFTPAPLPSAPQVETAKPPETIPQPQVPAQNPPSLVAAETNELKAQFVFSQPCWLVINVDGKPALEGTFSQGMTKELTAKEQIELVTVGNAGGVSITLNGKTLPSLGTSGQVVRNVFLKKDNLSQVSLLP
jgi:cytoskeleton protein RodZ